PLLILHLLRQLDDHPSLRPERFRNECVAGGAHLRLPNVFRLGWFEPAGGCSHDSGLPGLNLERTVNRPATFGSCRLDRESPDKALGRSQLFFTDLMAQRTGHAVRGKPVAWLSGV